MLEDRVLVCVVVVLLGKQTSCQPCFITATRHHDSTYSFAKTPLNAAKAPEPSAQASQGPEGLEEEAVVDVEGPLALKSSGDGSGSSGCSAEVRGIVVASLNLSLMVDDWIER